jgi:hypothetical protein
MDIIMVSKVIQFMGRFVTQEHLLVARAELPEKSINLCMILTRAARFKKAQRFVETRLKLLTVLN